MTPAAGHTLAALAVTLAAGSVVVCGALVALALLVLVLWRRSADDGVPPAFAGGPRIDSHAVARTAAPATGSAGTRRQSLVPDEWQAAPTPAAAPGPARAARGPHPSGLGAAELAAIVEDGLASLRSDLDRLGGLIESVTVASVVPQDLPARSAAQQVALVEETTAMIGTDLEAARRLAATVAADVGRGDEARDVVHGELARIGLPTGFFSAMDNAAADLAVDVVRIRMAVERLVRRFEALSSLYSSVRPVLELLGDVDEALGRAIEVSNTWRRAPEMVDLVSPAHVPDPLPG